MKSGIAVYDASPLIAFHQADHLDLLPALFLQAVVPQVVAAEVAPSLGALPHWLSVRDVLVVPPMPRQLDPGETAAIALALEIAANAVVLDDLAGRLAAVELKLPTIGSLGLLVRAKRFGLLREVRPVMDAMVANGLFANAKVQREILEAAEESGSA